MCFIFQLFDSYLFTDAQIFITTFRRCDIHRRNILHNQSMSILSWFGIRQSAQHKSEIIIMKSFLYRYFIAYGFRAECKQYLLQQQSQCLAAREAIKWGNGSPGSALWTLMEMCPGNRLHCFTNLLSHVQRVNATIIREGRIEVGTLKKQKEEDYAYQVVRK